MSEFPTERQELLKNKDPCPYEWIDDNRKFNYPRLPPKGAFYSRLNSNKRDKGNGHITNSQYNNLKNVWNIFNFKTFKDFHIHYLKKDVLLLADVFEKFISTCLRFYSLDPTHYFSAPELSWNVENEKNTIRKSK